MAVESNHVVRTGECRQCGECCRRLGWLLVHADEHTIEWIRVRDPEIEVEPDTEVPGYYNVSIPYPCGHLVDLGGGRFSCDMHDTKPLLCKQYPAPSDELKPGCGYGFRSSCQSSSDN